MPDDSRAGVDRLIGHDLQDLAIFEAAEHGDIEAVKQLRDWDVIEPRDPTHGLFKPSQKIKAPKSRYR